MKAANLARLRRTQRPGSCSRLYMSNAVIVSYLIKRAGFFLPSEDKRQARREIERFIASLSSRAINTLGVLKTAKRVLRRLDSTPLDEIGA